MVGRFGRRWIELKASGKVDARKKEVMYLFSASSSVRFGMSGQMIEGKSGERAVDDANIRESKLTRRYVDSIREKEGVEERGWEFEGWSTKEEVLSCLYF